MKSWLRIFLVCFAILGSMVFIGYWYMDQFNQTFDDFAKNQLTFQSFNRQYTELASRTIEVLEFASTTVEVLEIASTTEPLMASSTDKEIPKEPVVMVLIKETSIGYLNARAGPGLAFEKIIKLESGGEYELIKKENGWYNLKIDEDTDAWVISTFVKLL